MAPPDASVVLVDGPWSHRDVAANGARFHVAEAGNGPLVLLLHGFPEFWWAWRQQIAAVAEQGYRVVAMDLRGYGASDKPPRGYDPFTLAGDVAGVVRSLGELDAVVVGHGWGGLVGWVTSMCHPKQVRRLVTVSAPHPRQLRAALLSDLRMLLANKHALEFQLPWSPERRLTSEQGRYVEEFMRSWSASGWPDAATAACYRQAIQVPGVAFAAVEYYRWAVRSFARPDGLRFARRMAAPINAPVLQLHGAADAMMSARCAQGSGRYVEAPYRWRLLDGVGHFPHEEDPHRFNAELLAWLADPEPDR
jgi:pimeloyl-ACP methyl ester carboxylesterase